MNPDSISQSITQLFALLEKRKIKYVLVDGVALLTYIEGRNTEDIDLIMAASSLEKIPEIEIREKELYFRHAQFEGLQIDILLTENPLFEEVRRKYTVKQPFQEQNIPTASVEGLLLLKCYALPSLYRQGSFSRVAIYENDIAILLHDYPTNIPKILNELAQYLDENDLSEIRKIVSEIQERIARFRKGLKPLQPPV